MDNFDLSEATFAEEAACRLVMERLLATLPEAIATLSAKRNSSGLIFALEPANKKSAQFGIHYDGCVDVFFGDFGTTFEVEFGLHAALAFAERVGEAVIAGRCCERAGFIGVRGTVEVDGKPYRSTHFFHLRLFPKTIRYAPYCSPSVASDRNLSSS